MHSRPATEPEKEFLHNNRDSEEPFLNLAFFITKKYKVKLSRLMSREALPVGTPVDTSSINSKWKKRGKRRKQYRVQKVKEHVTK